MKNKYIAPSLMVVKLKPCKILAGSILLNSTTTAIETTDNDGVILNQDAKSSMFGWDDDEPGEDY